MTSRSGTQPVFAPKLFSLLPSYSLKLFWGDLSAGVIVGIVALPLAIAFAIASGVTPERGLTTAIIAGFLISVLGGSRVQIGGPTGAFVVIVYHIVERYGVDGLLACTVMAGVILVLLGVLRLGAIIKFLPYPLTVGFTAGIAVIIAVSQLKDALGLAMGPLPGDFLEKCRAYAEHASSVSPAAMGVSAGTLAVLWLWPKLNRRLPASLIAILLMTALAHAFAWPVETIGSRFGALPAGLPAPHWPPLSLARLGELLGPAFTVALLGAIESLLSATVADSMIEGRHRSNTELIAQGIANIVVPFFGGIPATGAIARTATNVRNGGRTPVAGMVHAATLFAIVLAFGRWAALIPLSVLAAILLSVAYHMGEWHAFRALLRAPRTDVAVLLVTFGLTVLADLTVAVEIGLMLSVFLFMKRMTDVTEVRQVTQELNETSEEAARRERQEAAARRALPAGVEIYEAEGAFFFGVAELLRETLDVRRSQAKAIILRMERVLVLDASGLRALRDLRRECARQGCAFILEGLEDQPRKALEHAGLAEEFGRHNIAADLAEALARAQAVLAGR